MRRLSRGTTADLILGVLVVAVIVTALSVHSVRQRVQRTVQAAVSTPLPSPTPLPPQLFRPTQTAEAGAYALTVTSVQADTQGRRPYVPARGYVYYVADVRLKNTGQNPLAVNPVAQMFVRDSKGTVFAPVNGPVDTPLAADTIAPGEERAGQLSFLMLQSRTGLRLTFDPNPVAAAPVTFDLGY